MIETSMATSNTPRTKRGAIDQAMKVLLEDPSLNATQVARIVNCSTATVYDARTRLREGVKPSSSVQVPQAPSSIEFFIKSVLKTFSPEKAVKIISAALQ